MVDTAWIALSLLPKIGTKTMAVLVESFDNLEDVVHVDTKTLTKIRGIGKVTAAAIQEVDFSDIERQVKLWQERGVTIHPSYAEDYPPALRTLKDAPPTLFMRGRLTPNQKAVAIVGTRNPGNKARQIAFDLGQLLAKQGWMIISGLALGIDTAAHEGALSVNGITSAVLGSGVLEVYPDANKPLANRILEQGAIIGENHPYASPKPARLVSRNRIISGLCQHVIVVETSADGGAMYAARFAREQGRILHALDLPASGNRELLSNDAHRIPPDLENFTLAIE